MKMYGRIVEINRFSILLIMYDIPLPPCCQHYKLRSNNQGTLQMYLAITKNPTEACHKTAFWNHKCRIETIVTKWKLTKK